MPYYAFHKSKSHSSFRLAIKTEQLSLLDPRPVSTSLFQNIPIIGIFHLCHQTTTTSDYIQVTRNMGQLDEMLCEIRHDYDNKWAI
jgi:hypothetical protein